MPRATLKRHPDDRYVTRYKGQDFYGDTQTEAFAPVMLTTKWM